MNLFELYDGFTKIASVSNEKLLALTDGFRKVEEAFARTSSAFNEISEKIFNFVNNFPVDGLYEYLCSYCLLEIYYPPCLYLSAKQTKDVFFILSEGTDDAHKSKAESIIQDAYNDELIAQLLKNWETRVSKKRFPILAEGIQCYFDKKYYACNALLLTQIGGIIRDNDKTFKQCDIEEITSRVKHLYDEQMGDIKDSENKNAIVMSEKNTAQRHLLINLQGSLCAFTEYFLKYLYSSGKIEPIILENVANRNKVLHGEWCEFGTKKTALKTIIAVDLLINLPEMQLRITGEKYDA